MYSVSYILMLIFRDPLKFLWQLWLYWSWGDIWIETLSKYKRAHLFCTHCTSGNCEPTTIFAKEYELGPQVCEKRNYVQMTYWAVPLAMGGKPLPGRDGPQSCAWACRCFPPRYAVLCGQLAEHEGIQRRIQSGFSFKVRKASPPSLVLV